MCFSSYERHVLPLLKDQESKIEINKNRIDFDIIYSILIYIIESYYCPNILCLSPLLVVCFPFSDHFIHFKHTVSSYLECPPDTQYNSLSVIPRVLPFKPIQINNNSILLTVCVI